MVDRLCLYDRAVFSIEELEAASQRAEHELVAHAAFMSERRTSEWTLEERRRLHRLSQVARKARAELLRASRPFDLDDQD